MSPTGFGKRLILWTRLKLGRSRQMRVRATEIVSVIVAVVACAGAVVSALYTYTSRNRELDIELIKIGISILRADPAETQTNGAREWAIQVIESYSRRPFSPEAKAELLKTKLGYEYGYDLGGGSDFSQEIRRPKLNEKGSPQSK
jgi:hypothetical protein